MIKVKKYATLKFQPATYLSFNTHFELVNSLRNSEKMLMIFLNPGRYILSGELVIRHVQEDPYIMEYIHLKKGVYNFVECEDENHLLLK